MSRALISALSAATVVGGTAAFYFLWKKFSGSGPPIIDRLTLKKIVITLRKRIYSTLREIAFIVNNIRTLEGDLQVRKISQVFMRDGGSGQKKLAAIESLVLKQMNVTPASFETSCELYLRDDIEIKILLQNFRKDLDLALEGVIQTYKGPLPPLSSEKILEVQEQIIKRRMDIIYRRFTKQLSNQDCLRLEFQIEQYLSLQMIQHQQEANQKIFLSLLEHNYRNDYQFKQRFQQLQLQMEMFIIQMQAKSKGQYKQRQKEQQSLNKNERSMSIHLCEMQQERQQL